MQDPPIPGTTTIAAKRPEFSRLLRSPSQWLPPYKEVPRQRSLVGRFLLLSFTWAIFVYLLAVGGVWITSSLIVEDYFKKQVIQELQELDEAGTPLFASSDPSQFAAIETRLRNRPEIAYLRYYTADGRLILAEYQRDNLDIPLPQLNGNQRLELARAIASEEPYKIDDIDAGGSLMRITAPISIGSIPSDGLLNFDLNNNLGDDIQVIGFIDLGMDFAVYRQQLLRIIALGSAVIALMFILAAVLGRQLIRRALRPLSDLQEPLAKLAQGEIDIHVTSAGDEEIVAISTALNTTISALRERDEKLRRLANHDSLTGLINRHCFTQELEHELDRLQSIGTSTSALLFVDLDQFKYVNDTLGHAAGDRLLVRVAEVLKARMRDHDSVSRFGGDEFTILARDVERDGAASIARSIVNTMRDFYFVESGQTFNVYCSVGISMTDGTAITSEELLAQADMACYDAKSRGRNGYQFYEVSRRDRSQMTAEVSWSRRIKELIKTDSFVLHFQPIVSLRADDTELYEVLLRMPSDDGDIIPPTAFFPAAERFGLVVDIDHWVIDHAIKTLARLRSQGRNINLAINLSGHAFEDNELVSRIQSRLNDFNIDPQHLVFEITEQLAVRFMDSANLRIQRLMDLGCRFALDDFGAGFSSFNYIKHLPVNYIKIDGSFIEHVATDEIDQAMVKSIIQIAKTLGKRTIAEYVSDRQTLELLWRLGIDYAQGDFIGAADEKLPRLGLTLDAIRARGRPALAKPVLVK